MQKCLVTLKIGGYKILLYVIDKFQELLKYILTNSMFGYFENWWIQDTTLCNR